MDAKRSDGSGDTLAYVLSGGGGRGAFEAGVLERLSHEPRFANPAIVAGTSAGAINAALFASGKTPAFIRDFWFELGEARLAHTNDSFFSDSLLSGRGLLGAYSLLSAKRLLRAYFPPRWPSRGSVVPPREHPGVAGRLANFVEVLLTERFQLVRAFLAAVRACHLVDTTKLRAKLVKAFGGESVQHDRCELAINAVDACSNRVVRFVTGTPRTRDTAYVVVNRITVDMVLASASIPILFPSVALDGRLLWDGGVLSNTPMAPAVAMGANRIVTVLVAHDHKFQEPCFANLGQALERLVDMLLENAYNADRGLLLSRNRVAELDSHYHKVFLYEAIRPPRDSAFDAASLIDFQRPLMEHFYDLGHKAAARWLRATSDGPREDKDDRTAPARTEKAA